MRLNMGEWILTSSIFILIVLLIRRVFKNRLTAKVRYSIWFLVLLRLILPFSFFDSSFSLLNLLPGQETEMQTVPADWGELPMQQEITPQPLQTLQQPPQSAGSQNNGNLSYIPPNDKTSLFDIVSFQKVLFTCWIIGMMGALLIIAGSNIYFVNIVKKSRKMTEILQNRQSLPVYTSENVPIPCMFGLIKPAIYIRNRDLEDEVALSYIIKHENTHYRHRDHIWAFIRGLCLIFHWYNPLVWIAAYCSKQDAELFCDESVIRPFSANEAEEYGKVLIGLSVQNMDYRTVLSCATTLSSGKNNLKERIGRIAGRPRLFICSTAAVIVLCIVALIFTFTGKEKSAALIEDATVVPTETPANNPAETQTDDSSDELADITSETPADLEPTTDPIDMNPLVAEDGLLINDYLVDMNGDGITDILRLSNINDAPLDDSLTESEALRKAVEGNTAGYYQIALYDGARAADMQHFKVGDEINEEALITTFEPAQAHAGNMQYSYYEENGRGYLISNCPYFGQDAGSYSYEIFTYINDWKQYTVAENSLSFSTIPYSPEITHLSPNEYMSKNFPIEEMIDYTMELKDYLDKAVIIMDTSVWDKILFTTCYEDVALKPDAYAIWYWDWDWDNTFNSVNSEETLREALSDMYDIFISGRHNIYE